MCVCVWEREGRRRSNLGNGSSAGGERNPPSLSHVFVLINSPALAERHYHSAPEHSTYIHASFLLLPPRISWKLFGNNSPVVGVDDAFWLRGRFELYLVLYSAYRGIQINWNTDFGLKGSILFAPRISRYTLFYVKIRFYYTQLEVLWLSW